MRIRRSHEPPAPIMVVTAERMRALDALATERYGIPSLLLMENAGRAVFDAAVEILGSAWAANVLVVCGPGNNGGDGFVVARHLHNAHANVTIAYYGDRAKAKGDALANIEIAEKMGLDIVLAPDDHFWLTDLKDMDLIIDALLGTGTKGELREPYSRVIEKINECSQRAGIPVLAVDIPSGVDADTGAILGTAVEADVTVTFGLPKIGLVTYPGAERVGELVVADITIPTEALDDCDSETALLDDTFAFLPLRPADSNKGMYGRLAIVAGSVGMTGAAAFAAEGALRIGAGLVTLLVPESLNDIMEVKVTEAMTIPVPEGRARAFGMASLDKVLEYVGQWDAAVIGPGFGRDPDTIAFTLELVRRIDKPAIIDADALYALSTNLAALKEHKAPIVITPHPGEMARLLGTSVAEVQSNRLEVARSFAKEYDITVVLKGAGSIIAGPDGAAFINTTGTPGMASGGTGDVLSGMIGGLLAQDMELPAWVNACTAVYLHGRAGEIAAERLGVEAMLASDIVNCLPDAIKEVSPNTECDEGE